MDRHLRTEDSDPYAVPIAQALQAGWSLIPQAGVGVAENALVRHGADATDVITLPELGDAQVIRLQGGPTADFPRDPGTTVVRLAVSLDNALQWARGPGYELPPHSNEGKDA